MAASQAGNGDCMVAFGTEVTKHAKMGNFCPAIFVFHGPGWVSKSEITQCPSLPVPSADTARVGQEGDSRRPQLWTQANCVQFKYAAFVSFGVRFREAAPHRRSSAPKVKKHGADQVCVLSLPRWNGEDL